MSFPDMVVIFGLALVIFGPKKLPEIARQLGKLVYEFRKASNEFKLQMEEELRVAEEAEQRKNDLPSLTATSYTEEAGAAASASREEETVPTILPPSSGEPVGADSPSASFTRDASGNLPEVFPSDLPESFGRVVPVADEAAELDAAGGERQAEVMAMTAGSGESVAETIESALPDGPGTGTAPSGNGHASGAEQAAFQHHG